MFYAKLFLIRLTLIWYQIFMVAERGQTKNTFWSSVQILVRIHFLYHIIFYIYLFNNFAHFFHENIQIW